ncbi:MAG: hypothetical protein QM734_00905 [Cyclobacteriaceae bacterium]
MKRFLILAALIISCKQKPSESSKSDSTFVALHKDSTGQNQTPTQKSDAPVSDFQGVDLDFEKLDSALQEVLNNFHEPDKLNSVINSDYGFYWVKSGAGIYPVVKEIKSSDDLSDCEEYLFFVRQPMLLNGYFDNPKGMDLCHPQSEGAFIFKAKDNQLIFKAYQGRLLAINETMTADLAKRLHSLDSRFEKFILFSLSGKDGETTQFDLYLARIDGKLYLAAIDTRECEL